MKSRPIRKLKIHYIWVLAFLGILASGNYTLLTLLIHEHNLEAKELKLIGRQQMLTQRITLLASQYDSLDDRDLKQASLAELKTSIDQMRQTHLELLHRTTGSASPAPHSRKVNALYFGPDKFVDAEIRAFLSIAASDLRKLQDGAGADASHSGDWHRYGNYDTTVLLNNLSQIVNQFQSESNARIRDLGSFHFLSFALTLISLGGAGFLVFRPAYKSIRSYVSELTEAEERFRFISQSPASAAIIAIDQKGTVFFWNLAAEKIFGYSAPEMLSRSVLDIVPERLQAMSKQAFLRTVNNENAFEIGRAIETFARRKNGEEFPINLSLGTWTKNEERYFCAIIHDITSDKLALQQLQTAKEEAEKANLAKSDFLACMSHELRTPLNAVLGFAQLLKINRTDPLSVDQNGYVNHIEDGGRHLLELINSILDLAAIEADQTPLSIGTVNASEIIADSVAQMVPESERRHIRIIDLFSHAPRIDLFTDHVKLRQILFNLLSNAVKYNREYGTVTVEGRSTENGFLRLSISDTGIGIPKTEQADIFKMFFRHGRDHMTATDGAGIGLSVTKRLVERLGGRIGFESQEGVGSLFWFELPQASNGAILIWNNAWRVGIAPIDRDHRNLVSMYNRIIRRSGDVVEMARGLHQLIAFTRYHLKREILVMEICQHPALEEHHQIRRDFVARVSEMPHLLHAQPDHATMKENRDFLRNWLFQHISTVDKKVAFYSNGLERKLQSALEALEAEQPAPPSEHHPSAPSTSPEATTSVTDGSVGFPSTISYEKQGTMKNDTQI